MSKHPFNYSTSDFFDTEIAVLPLNHELLHPPGSGETNEVSIWKPHVTNYYIFDLVEEGEYSIMLDFKEITIQGPAFIYFLPRQIKCMLGATKLKGYCLVVHSSLLEKKLAHSLEVEIRSIFPIPPSDTSCLFVSDCLRLLHNMIGTNTATPGIQRSLAMSCIEVMVNTMLGKNVPNQQQDNRPAKYAQDFFLLLLERGFTQKSPHQYAVDLNISPAYLNECIKSVTGKPVSYWVQHELILESKRLLHYSDLSVKEIAYKLGFDDHAYFSRFFAKNTGMGASQFRKLLLF